jgi:hypothetical protein
LFAGQVQRPALRRAATATEITGFALLNVVLWVAYARRRVRWRAQGTFDRWEHEFIHGRPHRRR